MPGDYERTCVVCGGPIGKGGSDICCKEEDQYLLICCKGHLREFQDRECGIDEVIELLFDDLAEFLEKRNDDIENYDHASVYSELERRTLRWVNNKMINFRQVSGISFCTVCGATIMAGRTKCATCAGAGAIGGILQQGQSAPAQPPRRGMHFKK
ncbi:MAG: hypothetical protein C4527_25075 [Candidatus Omnitrophota bacterium]|nr:MAG: hypothetical protein C4527_25075 [Candidatus Omnitrophota bacterium]